MLRARNDPGASIGALLNKSERSQHPKFLDLIPPSCLRNAPAFPPPIPEVATIEVF